MKSFHSALLVAVLLAVGAGAAARPAGHLGSPSSFKSGFSSQKGNSARSAPASLPPAASRNSGPGAFGGGAAASDGAAARGNSALGRDLDQRQAQANALKSLDARRAAATPAPPVNAAPQRPAPSPSYQQPAYPQPVIVQQQSSGWMYGALGFMLGRALSQHPQPVYQSMPPQSMPPQSNPAPDDWSAYGGARAGEVVSGASPARVAAAPSSAAAALRVLAWLALLGGGVWLAVYMVRKWRRIRAAHGTHYSFERN